MLCVVGGGGGGAPPAVTGVRVRKPPRGRTPPVFAMAAETKAEDMHEWKVTTDATADATNVGNFLKVRHGARGRGHPIRKRSLPPCGAGGRTCRCVSVRVGVASQTLPPPDAAAPPLHLPGQTRVWRACAAGCALHAGLERRHSPCHSSAVTVTHSAGGLGVARPSHPGTCD